MPTRRVTMTTKRVVAIVTRVVDSCHPDTLTWFCYKSGWIKLCIETTRVTIATTRVTIATTRVTIATTRVTIATTRVTIIYIVIKVAS